MAKRRRKKSSPQKSALRATSSKMSRVVKNLLVFLVLAVLSFILYQVTSSGFWNDLFFLLLLVFGFVALAFLIVWLVLMWLKALGK